MFIIGDGYNSDHVLNLLLHEFFFSLVLERQPKIGCHIVYRLIDAALIGIFFIIPSYFKIENLAMRTLL